MTDNQDQHISELKTNAFERRLSLAKASLKIGGRWATSSASGLFLSKEKRDAKRQEFMKEQANYLVAEMGKLKGSVVKIGQMMALYGEHFLPEEITEALHELNNKTPPIAWEQLEPTVRETLGASFDDLIINPHPLGTASLAQVHRAKRKSDGLELVLKVQYPGVADAIDSDLKLFKNLIKMTNAVPQTREFEDWFVEVRDMLKREVDYFCEADTTMRFYERLKDDKRYIVPRIIESLSSERLLTMTYEHGIPINGDAIMTLPQAQRDALGEASLEIMIRELFEWGEMQTDPNFGNYLVRLADNANEPDQIVLLDFGAIRQFDDNLLTVAQNLIKAGNSHSKDAMLNAMTNYDFFTSMPEKTKADMADIFLVATEPFRVPEHNQDDEKYLDENGNYHWQRSDLHARLMKQMNQSVASRHFAVPPKEFMFISRKFIGAYTFMTVIDARTKTFDFIKQYQ